MIGHISGTVLFSDGREALIAVPGGLGYQVHFNATLEKGSSCSLYLSCVIRENAHDLYGFPSFRDKKMFEMLTEVKGVGPKSAYSLVALLGTDTVIEAIDSEDRTLLTKTPGIGPKAAAQIVLDLAKKIRHISPYPAEGGRGEPSDILSEALSACEELGFKADAVSGIARKILRDREVSGSDQLVRLVLREI